MNGKIDKDGHLSIERAWVMKSTLCPFDNPSDEEYRKPVQCGDWCPLFGEPWPLSDKSEKHWLHLCHRELEFETFTDERG
jgi:hypothetical protein